MYPFQAHSSDDVLFKYVNRVHSSDDVLFRYFNHAQCSDNVVFSYLGRAQYSDGLPKPYLYEAHCYDGLLFGYGFQPILTKATGRGNSRPFTTKINLQMKILEEDEAKDLIPLTKGRETLLSAKLKQLKVGQALIVTPKDWKTTTSPYRVANNIAKRHGWKFEQGRMPDGSGWLFKRVG